MFFFFYLPLNFLFFRISTYLSSPFYFFVFFFCDSSLLQFPLNIIPKFSSSSHTVTLPHYIFFFTSTGLSHVTWSNLPPLFSAGFLLTWQLSSLCRHWAASQPPSPLASHFTRVLRSCHPLLPSYSPVLVSYQVFLLNMLSSPLFFWPSFATFDFCSSPYTCFHLLSCLRC